MNRLQILTIVLIAASISSLNIIKHMDFSNLTFIDIFLIGTLVAMWIMFSRYYKRHS